MIASLNAFNEEFTLRAAPWVSSLMLYVKKTLLITTVFFALGHYFGVPNGIIGVILSGFLGWFIGKSILETHVIFLAWLAHSIPDLVIFSFFLMSAG